MQMLPEVMDAIQIFAYAIVPFVAPFEPVGKSPGRSHQFLFV